MKSNFISQSAEAAALEQISKQSGSDRHCTAAFEDELV
jgi:hypothetical protein